MSFDPRIYKLIQSKLYDLHALNSKSISFLNEFNDVITQFVKELSDLDEIKYQNNLPKNGADHNDDSPDTQ